LKSHENEGEQKASKLARVQAIAAEEKNELVSLEKIEVVMHEMDVQV
jgi:hypothetical protein